MKIRTPAALLVALAMLGSSGLAVVAKQSVPTTWDDLNLTKSSRSQRVYLLPGANFQPYSKVMLDKTEVAFRQNWVRDYNRSSGSVSRRLTDSDVDRITKQVHSNFGDIFTDEYQKAGYQVVQEPGPDVLQIRTAVINLSITAPDTRSAGRSYTYTWDAGEATLVVEARDSETGALLGRALDRRVAGDSRPYLRNAVTNRADFRALFRQWAKESTQGLNRLKAQTQVAMAQK